MRILYIDDEPDLHLAFIYIPKSLAKELEFFHAYSGQEALDMLQDQAFDLILLDINLPFMRGPEIYKRMARKDKKKVIFITSDAIRGIEEQVGIKLTENNNFLYKPLGLSATINFIRTKLASKKK
jgi:CheY-like chemotaxis protein